MRISEEQRRHTEQRIRAATGALLRGELPPGGKTDITTLARQAQVSRATLYRSYPQLLQEFEQQLSQQHATGHSPDPREAQIARLKTENTELKKRIAQKDAAISDHQQFRTLATSRLLAQHEEIRRLRTSPATTFPNVHDLNTHRATTTQNTSQR